MLQRDRGAAKAADLHLGNAADLSHDLGGQKIHHPDKLSHLAADRAAIQLLRAGKLGNLPLEHHGDAVRHDKRLFLIVGDQNEGDADLALQPSQFDLHLFAHLLVQGAEGFIQQQHLRLQDQRPGQRHPLALTTRQGMGGAVAVAAKPDHRQRLGDALGHILTAQPFAAQTETDVFRHCQMGKDRIGLEHHVGRPHVGGHPVHILAVDFQCARRQILKPRDGAQQGGLAAAGWAQEREKLTLPYLGIDAAERVIGAIVFLHILQFDDGLGCG